MNYIRRNALYLIWVMALLATVGSLYFQYARGFPPCVLCWYQRIAMYPLVVIMPIGIIMKDRLASLYALVLSGIGLVIAVYHNLLYYKILPESAAPCISGFSCTTKFIEWLGFITIPLLSLMALAFIFIISLIAWKGAKHDQGN